MGYAGQQESIIKAAKRVRISRQGLNWKWMQEEKFTQSEALLSREEPDLANHQLIWKERLQKK